MDAEEDLQLLLRTWQQGQLLGSPRDFDRRVRKSSDVGMHGFSLSQRCRALPQIRPVGTAPQSTLIDPSVRDKLHRRLDEIHLTAHAHAVFGPHRTGTKCDFVREINALDLPPPSLSLQEMNSSDADRRSTPRNQQRPTPKKLGSGDLVLNSGEHISRHLAQRLTLGQRKDDEELTRAIGASENFGSADHLSERGIKPLMIMAESRYREIQRDSAAALYSLSISDKNKVAFMEAKALETLVQLAKSPDTDIRRNVVGAMYRLSMEPKIKRRFVQIGVLKPLLPLVRANGRTERDICRHGIMCLKELCENVENRMDVMYLNPDKAAMLDAVFDMCYNLDPRNRRMAGFTLVSLLAENENKICMLDLGALPRLIALLRSRDSQLRRSAVDCIARITKLHDIHPLPIDHCYMVTSLDTLAALVEACGTETEVDPLLGLVKCLHALLGLVKQDKSTRGQMKPLKRQLVKFGLLERLMSQAKRLMGNDIMLTETAMEVLAQATRMVSLLSKSHARLQRIESFGHSKTALLLCKCSDKRVRRLAAKILARLSMLHQWKAASGVDADSLAGIFSISKIDDSSMQIFAAEIIAELAELPSNRVAMEKAGAVPVLLLLAKIDNMLLNRNCIRTLALMAEAVANRVSMAYRALDVILDMLWSEDTLTQDFALRCAASLAAPAGIIAQPRKLLRPQEEELSDEAITDGDGDGDGDDGGDGDSHSKQPEKPMPKPSTPPKPAVAASAATFKFTLFGRYGSDHRVSLVSAPLPDDDNEEESAGLWPSSPRDADNARNAAMREGRKRQGGSSPHTSDCEDDDERDTTQRVTPPASPQTSDDDEHSVTHGCTPHYQQKKSMEPRPPPSRGPGGSRPRPVSVGFNRQSVSAVAAKISERHSSRRGQHEGELGSVPVEEQNSPLYWTSSKGVQQRVVHNTQSIDRIHMRLLESSIFVDLFDPSLPALSPVGLDCATQLVAFTGQASKLAVEESVTEQITAILNHQRELRELAKAKEAASLLPLPDVLSAANTESPADVEISSLADSSGATALTPSPSASPSPPPSPRHSSPEQLPPPVRAHTPPGPPPPPARGGGSMQEWASAKKEEPQQPTLT